MPRTINISIRRRPSASVLSVRRKPRTSILGIRRKPDVKLTHYFRNPYRLRTVSSFHNDIESMVYDRLLRISKLKAKEDKLEGVLMAAMLYDNFIIPNKVMFVRSPRIYSLAGILRNNLNNMLKRKVYHIHRSPIIRLRSRLDNLLSYRGSPNYRRSLALYAGSKKSKRKSKRKTSKPRRKTRKTKKSRRSKRKSRSSRRSRR